MLLARLQREDEAALAVEVGRLADDPAGQAADELVRRRGSRSAGRRSSGRADRLALADRHVAAVGAGRLEHAERDEIDVRDGDAAAGGGRGGERRRVLEAAEEVGLREDGDRRVLGRCGDAVRIGDAAACGHLDDLEAEPGRVGLHDLAHLRVERLGEHDLACARWRASR